MKGKCVFVILWLFECKIFFFLINQYYFWGNPNWKLLTLKFLILLLIHNSCYFSFWPKQYLFLVASLFPYLLLLFGRPTFFLMQDLNHTWDNQRENMQKRDSCLETYIVHRIISWNILSDGIFSGKRCSYIFRCTFLCQRI